MSTVIGVSNYSNIVINDLKKDLGNDYQKEVEGGGDQKKDKTQKGRTAKAWEYFLENYNKGKYLSIMADLKSKGFEYPFDLRDRSGSNESLISWVNDTDRDLDSKGIKDKAEKAKEFYLRLMPTENGGREKSEGGLDIKETLCLDETVRPMGEKLPFDVFEQKYQGERFDQCLEFADLYGAILRHIGVEAHVVNYKEGDYKYIPWHFFSPNHLFSPNKDRNSWKEMDNVISRSGDIGHAYVFFKTSGDQLFVADVDGVFEKIPAPIDHYFSAREEVSKYYLQKGSICFLQGKLEQGEEAVRVAMEIDPDDPDAHRNLGNIYRDSGRTEMAISEYETAIALKPDLPQVHSGLGKVYASLHMNENAITEYLKAVSINPDDYEAHYALGLIYIATGKLDLAIQENNEIIRINPKFASPYYVLAIIGAVTGHADDAIANLKKAVSLDASIIERAKVDPNFNSIRSDGRFIKILAGIR